MSWWFIEKTPSKNNQPKRPKGPFIVGTQKKEKKT